MEITDKQMEIQIQPRNGLSYIGEEYMKEMAILSCGK